MITVQDLFSEHFTGKTFASLPKYNAEVIAYANKIAQEIHDEEQKYLRSPMEMADEKNFEIRTTKE